MKMPYFLCEGLNGVVAFTVIPISDKILAFLRLLINFFSVTVNKKVKN